jgi:hypothetical protein
MNKLFLILGLLLSQPAFADIYKCQDQGTITITDSNTKENFKRCTLITEHKAQARETKLPVSAQGSTNVKVDPQTQEARDNKRKQILLSELKTEEDALQHSRLNGLTEDTHLHQKNIELLNKEISRIK